MDYFIGWDVGGWNCDKNANSRDAIVILDTHQKVLGEAWRGNLRDLINQADTSDEFVAGLFKLCQLPNTFDADDQVMLAIDIPLGFSQGFVKLLINKQVALHIGDSASNPYLFRQTEQFLFERGLKPLSSIKDMIGSQSTKGMHALAKFMPYEQSCGVWSDGEHIMAIEAYPSACKHSQLVNTLLLPYLEQPVVMDEVTRKMGRKPISAWANADEFDALTCALLGWLQINNPTKLAQPSIQKSPPISEGWIFVPMDSLKY